MSVFTFILGLNLDFSWQDSTYKQNMIWALCTLDLWTRYLVFKWDPSCGWLLEELIEHIVNIKYRKMNFYQNHVWYIVSKGPETDGA